MKQLILGSTSPYRKELLEKLLIPFVCQKPNFDEESAKVSGLAPRALAEHLAFKKAESLKGAGKVIIGGDQLVAFEGQILGKPHTIEKANSQLAAMSGKKHELITAVCIFDEERALPFVNITTLHMKKLESQEIAAYVQIDNPLDCAGAYKIEKHGMSLFEKIETTDFTAIQGLPLMELQQHLTVLGFKSFT
ncbi:MAG: Maf family protein [Bdellovibrionia bacterium]